MINLAKMHISTSILNKWLKIITLLKIYIKLSFNYKLTCRLHHGIIISYLHKQFDELACTALSWDLKRWENRHQSALFVLFSNKVQKQNI